MERGIDSGRSWGLLCVASLAALLWSGTALGAGAPTLYVGSTAGGQVSSHPIGADGNLAAASTTATGNRVDALAVSPEGTRLYSVDSGTNQIYVFDIQADGPLAPAPGSPIPTYASATSLTVTPDGKLLYVAHRSQVQPNLNRISIYQIDSQTGLLQESEASPFDTGNIPLTLAASNDSRFLYMASFDSSSLSAYRIAGSNGTLEQLSGSPLATPSNPLIVKLATSGEYLYMNHAGSGNLVSVYRVNEDTGALEGVGSQQVSGGIMELSPLGYMYIANYNSDTVSAYKLNEATGGVTEIQGSPFAAGNFPFAVGVTAGGENVYVANSIERSVSVFATDLATGVLAQAEGSPANSELLSQRWMAVTPNQGPVADLDATASGATVNFDASSSVDAGGAIASYSWDFGDGATAVSDTPAVAHTYPGSGQYQASVTATDGQGCSDEPFGTGQTLNCNGSGRATDSLQVQIDAGGAGTCTGAGCGDSQGGGSRGQSPQSGSESDRPKIRFTGRSKRCSKRRLRLRVGVSSGAGLERFRLKVARKVRGRKARSRTLKRVKFSGSGTVSRSYKVKRLLKRLSPGRYILSAYATNKNGTAKKSIKVKLCA